MIQKVRKWCWSRWSGTHAVACLQQIHVVDIPLRVYGKTGTYSHSILLYWLYILGVNDMFCMLRRNEFQTLCASSLLVDWRSRANKWSIADGFWDRRGEKLRKININTAWEPRTFRLRFYGRARSGQTSDKSCIESIATCSMKITSAGRKYFWILW